MFTDEKYASRRVTVRNVLYTVAESGLRLLSIFMPYLCEELWQRLPTRRATNDKVDPPSVCVAAYPYEPLHINDDVEAKIAILQVGRSNPTSFADTRMHVGEYMLALRRMRVRIHNTHTHNTTHTHTQHNTRTHTTHNRTLLPGADR